MWAEKAPVGTAQGIGAMKARVREGDAGRTGGSHGEVRGSLETRTAGMVLTESATHTGEHRVGR